MGSRKVVAFVGNAQAALLAFALDLLPDVSTACFGPSRNFPFGSPGRGGCQTFARADLEATLAVWRDQGKRVVLCEQVSKLSGSSDHRAFGEEVDVIRFPNLESYALWPLERYTPDQLRKTNASRLLQLDIERLAKVSWRTDIDLTAFITEHFASSILFNAPKHPAPALLAELLRQLLALPPLASIPGDKSAPIAAVEASRGTNPALSYPVPQSLTDNLECTWARSEIYGLWRSVSVLPFDDPAEAFSTLEKIVCMPADDPAFAALIRPTALAQYGELLVQQGRQADAIAALEEAVESDPFRVASRDLLVAQLRANGQIDRAQAVLRDGIDRPAQYQGLKSPASDVEIDRIAKGGGAVRLPPRFDDTGLAGLAPRLIYRFIPTTNGSRSLVVNLSTAERLSMTKRKFGHNVLHLAETTQGYYLRDFEKLARAVHDACIGFDRVMFMGGSKGGFGALALTRECARISGQRMWNALAFNPQTHIHPDSGAILYPSVVKLLASAKRNPEIQRVIDEFGDLVSLREYPNVFATVVYSSLNPTDAAAAEYISAPNVRLYPLHFAMHNTYLPFIFANTSEARIVERLTAIYTQDDDDVAATAPTDFHAVARAIKGMTWLPTFEELIDETMAVGHRKPREA